MVYADPFHSFCVALVVPSRQVLEEWGHKSGIKFENFSELCENADANKEVQQDLVKVRTFLYLIMMHFWKFQN